MWAEPRSLVAIGLLATVMMRVCLRVGAGSGDSTALLGAFDGSVVALVGVCADE